MSSILALLPLLTSVAPEVDEVDADGDGLSDFHERHKYFTDPEKADSDGDGLPDGDWNERREYSYSVRSILQVLPPVTPDVLCDDYQDARILLATPELVELEVVHYPLNTVASTLGPDPDWRRTVAARADLAPYLASTTTSNFDADMAREFASELACCGLDLAHVDDVTLVRAATRWLLEHSTYEDSFTTFTSTFSDGKAHLAAGTEVMAEEELAKSGRSLEEAWARELFALSMWKERVHGSCTSSAIFWTGCLRALGIPTRIVLCTPVIDATDAREWALAERALTRPTVRKAVLDALAPARGGWTSHTFNEVFVGGRWRRLNYGELAQNTLDRQFLGLMTHVATVRDWAEGEFAATWGRRQAGNHDDVLAFDNPYSALSLSDALGPHARLAEDPPVTASEIPLATLTIEALVWWDDPSVARHELERPYLLARPASWSGWEPFKAFTRDCDPRFLLVAEGHPALELHSCVGGISDEFGSTRWAMLVLEEAELAKLAPLVEYRLVPRNEGLRPRWKVAPGLVVRRAAK